MRINKFTIRLLVGGCGCVVIGIAGFIEGIIGGTVDSIVGGLIWKGPLLAVAGAALAYYGYRFMTDSDPTKPKSD